jgi:hypothetical protein
MHTWINFCTWSRTASCNSASHWIMERNRRCKRWTRLIAAYLPRQRVRVEFAAQASHHSTRTHHMSINSVLRWRSVSSTCVTSSTPATSCSEEHRSRRTKHGSIPHGRWCIVTRDPKINSSREYHSTIVPYYQRNDPCTYGRKRTHRAPRRTITPQGSSSKCRPSSPPLYHNSR